MNEPKTTILHLSEQIFSLRAAASAIYDRGFIAGEKPEELSEKIKPLTQALVRMIDRASKNDLPGCIMAVQRLESTARAHESDANYLHEKAANDRDHADKVKRAIMEQMKKDGVTERHVGDFTLVMVPVDGRDVLILR